jgi:hypothetical protein
MEQNQDRRRGHFHRGRRGADGRGFDRRTPSQPPERQGRDQVEVEQIMREIRARIAQRQGVDLTSEQIQDLAARRLESILDPRAIKPSLLEGLRRNAGAVTPTVAPKASTEPVYTFEDTTIYDSHRAILRGIRKLLNPLLKLLFNPNPLIRALHLQARLNVEAAAREAERDRRQAEWNALHYEIVQRLVTEISRLSLELQALSTRVESLAGRVDFNDRRVRGLEGTMHQMRPAGTVRTSGPASQRWPSGSQGDPTSVEAAPSTRPSDAGAAPEAPADTPQGEGARRRRRRRRGRRGSIVPGEPSATPSVPAPSLAAPESEPVAEAGVEQGAAPAAAEPESAVTESDVLAEQERREAAPVAPAPPPEEPQSAPPAPAPEIEPSDPDTDRSEQ